MQFLLSYYGRLLSALTVYDGCKRRVHRAYRYKKRLFQMTKQTLFIRFSFCAGDDTGRFPTK